MQQKNIYIFGNRIVAFQTSYVHLTGDAKSALLLSQACYWSNLSKDSNGWFYKSQAQWKQEIGLSRYEQERARVVLRSFPFWKEKRKGVPAKMYYHVDLQKLNQLIDVSSQENPYLAVFVKKQKPKKLSSTTQNANYSHTRMRETRILECGKPAYCNINKEITYTDPPFLESRIEKGESEPGLEPAVPSAWNQRRIQAYSLLFDFYDACKGSLGVDFVKNETDPKEIKLGAIAQQTEQAWIGWMKQYAQKRKIGWKELRERIIRMGRYMGDRKPFQLKTRNISLEEILDRPEWLERWMTESSTYDTGTSASVSVSPPRSYAFVQTEEEKQITLGCLAALKKIA